VISDIGHGESDLTLEWNMVRAMWLVGVAAHILLLAAVSRLLRDSRGN